MKKKALPTHKGILIWGELEKSGREFVLRQEVYELVSRARGLADIYGTRVTVAVPGWRAVSCDRAAAFGADRVLLCEHELLERFSVAGYTSQLCRMIEKLRPEIVLFGATLNGRALAPRVAARLGCGITADCTALEMDNQRRLIQVRPAYGGNIMASIIAPDTLPQIATVRPHIFPAESLEKHFCSVEQFEPDISPGDIVVQVVSEQQGGDSGLIEDAGIIVAVGRGIGSRENIKYAAQLTELLGGTLAASRSVVELGWADHSRQVGQSGRVVSPKLYIAIGISGAIQHQVGMNCSRTIVAINKDKQAPIFEIADYGIVGDFFELQPFLLDELQKLGRGRG